ncbi:MAG: family 10 glycosylhydrolase [Bacteroidota bacterium]
MNRRSFHQYAGKAMLLPFLPISTVWGRSSPSDKKPISLWINTSQRKYNQFTAEDWKKHLANLQELGITTFHVRSEEKALEDILKIKAELGITINRWLWIMNQPEATFLHQTRPEFFMVNRQGKSCLSDPPYVSYYKWLCPSRSEVLEYLGEYVGESLALSELDGIHLDYMRYPEVILPKGLWEQYNVIQVEELPKFDYCYCEVCRQGFQEAGGDDPLGMEAPDENMGWRHYRWDAITNIVQNLYTQAQAADKKVSASVFPTPYYGRKMVRQDWLNWKVDKLYPMMYHNFYHGDIRWLEDVMKDCLSQKKELMKLHASLYLPSILKEDFPIFLSAVKEADGIALFSEASLSRDYRKMLKEFQQNEP